MDTPIVTEMDREVVYEIDWHTNTGKYMPLLSQLYWAIRGKICPVELGHILTM